MKPLIYLFLILFVLILFVASCFGDEYKEGDFWRDSEKEAQGWVIISQNFSHIIYQAPDKELWTKCHSCVKLIKLKNAHKMILDGREQTIEHMNWPYRSFWRKIVDWIKRKKRPMISMVNNPEGGRIIDYEELYYCDNCYNPAWDK